MRLVVEKWSDVICPWCYIGKRKLETAIASVPEVSVAVRYLPFELNPAMPAEGIARREYRTAKFGSWERSLALDAQVVQAAAAEGLAFDYARQQRTPSTRLAHRLMWLAEADGGQEALAEGLFAGYFSDGLDLADLGVLRGIAVRAGLQADRVEAVLEGELGRAEVAAMLDAAARKGIRGVPHFRIGEIEVSGAQPAGLLAQAIRQAAGVLRGAA